MNQCYETILNLKNLENQETRTLRLKEGENYIHSDIIPNYCDKTINLFRIFIDKSGSGQIRTYRHFPVFLSFLRENKEAKSENTNHQKEIYLTNYNVRHLNSILITNIYPLIDNYADLCFSFEHREVKKIENNLDTVNDLKMEVSVENNEIDFDKKNENKNIISKMENAAIEENLKINSNKKILKKKLGKAKRNGLPLEPLLDDNLTDSSLKNSPTSNFNKISKNLNAEFGPINIKKSKLIQDDFEVEVQVEVENDENNLTFEDTKTPSKKLTPDSEEKVFKRLTRSHSSLKSPKKFLSHKRKRKQNVIAENIDSRRDLNNSTLNNSVNNSTFKTLNSTVNENLNNINPSRKQSDAKVNSPCSICLDDVNLRSCLDCCDHEFCKDCIDQWAAVSNECPLCKLEFKKIIYWEDNNQLSKKIETKKFKYEDEEQDDWYRNCAQWCMVCKNHNDEHLLLVCDKCHYNICHTYCAGLDLIPNDDWFCSKCRKLTNKTKKKKSRRRGDNKFYNLNKHISRRRDLSALSTRRRKYLSMHTLPEGRTKKVKDFVYLSQAKTSLNGSDSKARSRHHDLIRSASKDTYYSSGEKSRIKTKRF